MKQTGKNILVFLFCIFTLFTLQPVVQAAPDAQAGQLSKMTLNVQINQPEVFWKCSFINKDGDIDKAETIKVEWSVGALPKDSKTEVIITKGKTEGKLTIPTIKGDFVSFKVSVYGPHDTHFASMGMQVKNNGQTETITISAPETIEPALNWSNQK